MPNDALNYLANGIISENTINPSVYSQSSNTAKILTNTNENFVIEVLGNGDSLFNFYFIPPFSNQTTLIKPTTIDVSSGKTIATFNKDGLERDIGFLHTLKTRVGEL